MVTFEKVSKYSDVDFPLPVRKTANSAGYDFYVAEDIIIRPIYGLLCDLFKPREEEAFTLSQMADYTKKYHCRPTLVSTGVKCKMEDNQYLELMVRSSTPLKYWLILANGVGIIDSDYYNNPDNEGEIFLQLINLSPMPIQLKKGDCIGQGIIKTYSKIDSDKTTTTREGGFGSTNEPTNTPEEPKPPFLDPSKIVVQPYPVYLTPDKKPKDWEITCDAIKKNDEWEGEYTHFGITNSDAIADKYSYI